MEELPELISRQSGMVARRQLLTYGVDADPVRNQVRSGRWVEVTPRVLSTTTGPPGWTQWLWLAVLHAGPRSLVGGPTAAGVHGLKGWTRPTFTVLVDDELAFEPVPGIDFFRSRRSFELLRHPGNVLPACRVEPAVLMYAAYHAPIRAAHGILAAAVQQRVTTASRLLQWVDLLRPLRRAPDFRVTLADIDGGAHSGAELDVRRMCRRFGLALPARQRSRTDRSGKRRWTDCEWDLPDGTTLGPRDRRRIPHRGHAVGRGPQACAPDHDPAPHRDPVLGVRAAPRAGRGGRRPGGPRSPGSCAQ